MELLNEESLFGKKESISGWASSSSLLDRRFVVDDNSFSLVVVVVVVVVDGVSTYVALLVEFSESSSCLECSRILLAMEYWQE
jgi:hypothetical protein